MKSNPAFELGFFMRCPSLTPRVVMVELLVLSNPILLRKVAVSMSRLEKILAMLESEPGDTFLRYTLAMEYRKLGDAPKSLELLRSLAYEQPTPYVPAFFMAAQQLADQEKTDEARTYLRDGIEEARKQNDLHAASEMAEFLSELGK